MLNHSGFIFLFMISYFLRLYVLCLFFFLFFPLSSFFFSSTMLACTRKREQPWGWGRGSRTLRSKKRLLHSLCLSTPGTGSEEVGTTQKMWQVFLHFRSTESTMIRQSASSPESQGTNRWSQVPCYCERLPYPLALSCRGPVM